MFSSPRRVFRLDSLELQLMVFLHLVYVVYPETMGVPLEEMNRLFNDSPPEDIESSTLLRHSYDETTPPHLRKRAVAGADHSYSKPQKSMFNLFGLFRHASGTDYHTLGREDQ